MQPKRNEATEAMLVRDACRLYQVDPKPVLYAIAEGALPSQNSDQGYLVYPADLEGWIIDGMRERQRKE